MKASQTSRSCYYHSMGEYTYILAVGWCLFSKSENSLVFVRLMSSTNLHSRRIRESIQSLAYTQPL